MSKRIEQGAIKVVEIIGVSQESFEDAVQQGVAKASASIKDITGVEVIKYNARVEDSKIIEFHANLRLAFAVK